MLNSFMLTYILYKTTNLVTDKFYIGKHKQEGSEFDGYLGSGVVIRRAIAKYGKENFVRETLATFTNEQECYLAEKKFLAEHWTDDQCYNLESGGRGGKTVSAESKKRMSDAAKARVRQPHTKETRQKISARRQANASPGMSGRKHSEETKQKMAEAAKGRRHNVETRAKMSQNMKGRVPWNKGLKLN